jgi:hypothetical protein
MLTVDDVIARLGNLKRYAHAWRGRCPSCGIDAFAVTEGRDGRGLIYCHYGCDWATLLPP